MRAKNHTFEYTGMRVAYGIPFNSVLPKVVLDALFGNRTDPKLRFQGILFVHWVRGSHFLELMYILITGHQVFRQAEEKALVPIAPSIVSALLRLFDILQPSSSSMIGVSESSRSEMGAMAYTCMGVVARRLPSMIRNVLEVDSRNSSNKCLETLKTLISRLDSEEQNMRLAIQEALSSMWVCLHPLPADTAASLVAVLEEASRSKQYVTFPPK